MSVDNKRVANIQMCWAKDHDFDKLSRANCRYSAVWFVDGVR